jgi:cell division protein FtsB
MRIRRSVSRFFLVLVFPAVSSTTAAYFGNSVIWGGRGLLVLEDTQAKLGIEQESLTEAETQAAKLSHRIQLMAGEVPDSDLVEELARGQLMDGAPHQVSISRTVR